MDFKNKVALVTGATSGIGLAIVQQLLISDIKGVVLIDISSSGKEVSDGLSTKYGSDKIVFKQADVCNEQQFEGAFKTALTKYGQLDIVVNNAGIATDTEYEKTIAINLTSVVRGTLLGLKYMGKNKQGQGGVILNTSSITAIEYAYALPVYAATKAGVVNFTRGFGHSIYFEDTGVRILAILPGVTDTNITKSAKNLVQDEIFFHLFTSKINQPASAVAKGALYVIKNGESGSTWVIENSRLFLLPPPEEGSYGTLINDDLNQIG